MYLPLIRVLLEAPWVAVGSQTVVGLWLVEAKCYKAYEAGECDQPSYIVAEIGISTTLEPETLALRIAADHNASLTLNTVSRLRNLGYLVDLWSVDEVQDLRPDLNYSQAQEVLHRVQHDKDASIGINWGTIEAAATALFGPPPEDSDVE